jgi:hypothetical protein
VVAGKVPRRCFVKRKKLVKREKRKKKPVVVASEAYKRCAASVCFDQIV